MHPDLEALTALWTEDRALSELTGEISGLEANLAACARELEEAGAAHRVLEDERAGLKERDHALSRRLDTYVKRRDRTKRQLDEGQVGDFLVAQRQLEECSAIVDGIETELLELYEEIEGCEGRLERSAGGVSLREVKLAEARARLDERRPDLEAAIAARTAVRDRARDAVRSDYRKRYALLLEKGRAPLAPIVGHDCGACFKRIPQERLEAHKRDQGVETCPGCSRFLAGAG